MSEAKQSRVASGTLDYFAALAMTGGAVMRKYTVRMSFTVPAGTKAVLKAKAAARGMSLGAYIRDIIDDLQAEHDLAVTCAEVELRAGATVQ